MKFAVPSYFGTASFIPSDRMEYAMAMMVMTMAMIIMMITMKRNNPCHQ